MRIHSYYVGKSCPIFSTKLKPISDSNPINCTNPTNAMCNNNATETTCRQQMKNFSVAQSFFCGIAMHYVLFKSVDFFKWSL